MRKRMAPAVDVLRGSDTGKAVGLAGAMIANNVIALVASIVFARVVNDYGALAALVSYFLILSVVGLAIQVATAREAVLGHLGEGADLVATLERWGRSLAAFTALATILSILLRQPIADLVGVPHQAWAASAGIPAGCAYLAVSIMRGALQGNGAYRPVGVSLIGEQAVRLIAGTVMAVAGLGVAGAYLGGLVSFVAMASYCMLQLRARLGITLHTRGVSAIGLWRHVRAAAVPIAALAVIQFLQNIDLIIAKHQFSTKVASSYAVAAVAAKVLIWIAMGAGFYLVPETSRLRSRGTDPRPVLLRSLGIVAVCAIPCLLIYWLGAHPLLAVVFGRRRAIASSSLLPLGAAFTVLAGTYLAVQYMLALHRSLFLIAIGVVAAIEPVLLLVAAPTNPAGFAAVVLGVQAIGFALGYGLALRPLRTAPAAAPEAQPAAPPGPVLQAPELDRSA